MTDLAQDSKLTRPLQGAKTLTWAGTILIALGFLMPSIAFVFKGYGANNVPSQTGFAISGLLVYGGISWLITRKKSDRAKAIGRIVVGLLLCGVVAGHIADSSTDQVGQEFLRRAIDLSTAQQEKALQLNKRFEEIDFTQHLNPKALSSSVGMTEALQAVEQYRALLSERSALIQVQIAESQALVDSTPNEEIRRGAESTLRPAIESRRTVNQKMTVAQHAHADALQAVFSWSKANVRKLSTRDEHLLLPSAQMEAEFQALVQRLEHVEREVNQADKEANAEWAKALAKREQALKSAESILAK